MKKFCIFFTVLGWSAVIVTAQSGGIEKKLANADSLYHHFEEKEALKAYQSILDSEGDNYLVLWRTSFLYSRIGNRLESEEQQKEYFNNAIELANRALQIDSTDAQSNFVMAVAMGRKALISGARERVSASRAIKRHAEKAIELDSTHAGAWHVLGRWHFKVANLNFMERLAANTLFGGIPKASESKAAQFIEKAIDLNSGYVLYFRDLAEIYDSMGKDQQALSVCRKGLELQPLTPDDSKLKEECRKLIQDLQ